MTTPTSGTGGKATTTYNSTYNAPVVWAKRVGAAAAILLALYGLQNNLPNYLNKYVFDLIMLAGISIILAVSLNLINGITGQFSLGHAGFMAVGAYAAAAFTKYAGPRLALPPEAIYALSLMAAAACAGLAGFLVGLPSLRLRGDYLAIVTLGFGQIIIAIIVTIEELGGSLGMGDVPILSGGEPDIKFQEQITTTFLWLFALVVLCILTVRNLADSVGGRSMQAVREDEVAAEASGINTTRVKVLAFVVSSIWAGIAGGLYAHYNHAVFPDDYSFIRSVQIVVMVVLGGLGSITGAALAAVLLQIMEAAMRSVTGVFVVLIVMAVALSWPTRSARIAAMKRGGSVWGRWLRSQVGIGAILAVFWFFGRKWVESPDSPGKAEDWLRYVIYSLILIVLMLLRPQGLLGRSELSFARWRRRRNLGKAEPPESADAGIQGSL